MYFQGLEFYRIVRGNGVILTVDECNRLLNLLGDRNELKLAWCFYASIIRDGVSVNESTWSVIAKILYKDGKFERIGRVFDVGVYTRETFDFMIDGYGKRGDFGAAFDYLEKLCSRGMEPSFDIYASILDGACRYGNREVIENVLSVMVETGHISDNPASGYNLIIKKLCAVGRTFAVDLFFRRACDDNVELENATYECMFAALLREESRVEDAIELYNTLQLKKILVSESCYREFVIALCRQSPSLRISNLLVDIIRSGIIFKSPAKELSDFINKQCEERHWREAEELLYLSVSRGWLLDPVCYGSLVKRYCSTRQIDRAISLHDKLAEMEGTLETAAYNILVSALFRERRVEVAVRVFDYMKACKRVDSESFEVMIRELCKEKEMRKAMKCHDQMLEMGLKPDQRTYKRLIAGFR